MATNQEVRFFQRRAPSLLRLTVLSLLAVTVSTLATLVASAGVEVPINDRLKTQAVLVGGTSVYDSTGAFSGYTIFAEDYAPISPAPVYRFDVQRHGQTVYNERMITWVAAPPAAGHPTARHLKYNQHNRTETISRSLTAEVTLTPQPTLYSTLRWYIRSKPYGAVDPAGPKTWVSDLSNTISCSNWTFYTPGTYDVLFNATFYDGTSFRFNTTLNVARQPASISNVLQPTGYNGSAWLPNPSGQMLTIIGQPARSATATVRLVIQSQPLGSVVTGTFVKKPDATGLVQFNDIVASIPGSYTYNLEANLTSGAVKSSSSVVVVIERALPVKINILQSIGGIARFTFYDLPVFSIEDSVGPAYDSRINMTLAFSANSPSHTYDEFDSVAQWCGTGSNVAPPTGYYYVFPNLCIDLAGTYTIEARLSLPDGSSLSRYFPVVIFEPPTWQTFDDSPFAVNQIGVLSLRGDRPRDVDPVRFMLSTSADCLVQSSDEIVWTSTNDPYKNNVDTARNVSVVPFSSGLVYPCLKIPSQSSYGVLIQYYQQQFDEAYPYVTSFTVTGVKQCQTVSSSAAAQYRAVGWDTVESGRAYGCALRPPVSGTIAPCDCASHLQCATMRHPLFTPPGLDIGACVCCATWILALAGSAVAVAFIILYYTIYAWV